MKALLILNSLSTAEKEFLKGKQISGEYSPQEWLALFTKLRNFDMMGDQSRKVSGWIGCGGVLMSFISLFLLTIVVGFITLPIGLILAGAGLGAYFYLKGFDLPGDALTKAVMPIVKVMQEEMDSNGKLKLRVDLRGFEQKDKFISQGQPYERGAYYKIIDHFYRDPWFAGEALLADGTKLIWSVEDLVKHSKRSKRTARGKHKTKTKDARRSLVQMQAAMHEKKYVLPDKLKQKGPEGHIQTKKAGNCYWMNVRKMIKYSAGKTFEAPDLINVIAAAYIRASPVRGKQ